ncbi:hypothetical protein OSB04_024084 [Centaurea solstitialis]|uniref:Uncharacterized protein n=1 Tax=Centaurea solstitialis TaxID=347529 RepID=A0AA38T3X4_9ASTR|nr:hypothetical protein OSB04_024084 [Centaurea solstitialis]
MMSYLKVVKERIARFDHFSIEQIPRDQNTQADALANLGSAFNDPLMESILILHLTTPTIEMKEEVLEAVEWKSTEKGKKTWKLEKLNPVSISRPRVFKFGVAKLAKMGNLGFIKCLAPRDRSLAIAKRAPNCLLNTDLLIQSRKSSSS